MRLDRFIHLFTFILSFCFAIWGTGCCSHSGTEGGNEADTTPPTVVSVLPADDATDADLDATIIVTFSEPVDSSTLTVGNFYLTPEVEGSESQLDASPLSISGTLLYDEATDQAILTPGSLLSGTTSYLVTVETGVKDLAGNAMEGPYSSRFTTTGDGSDSNSTETTAPAGLQTVCAVQAISGNQLLASSSTLLFPQGSDETTSGKICSCPTSGGSINCFAQNICKPQRIAVDSNNVYFVPSYNCATPKCIYQCPLSTISGTCNPTAVICDNSATFVNGIQALTTLPGALFYGDGISAIKYVKNGLIATFCSTGDTNPTQTAIDSASVFYAHRPGANNDPTTLGLCPLSQGSTAGDLYTASKALGFEFISDGSSLYFTEGTRPSGSSQTDWTVKKVAKTGGSPVTLLSGITTASQQISLQVANGYLYVGIPGTGSLVKVKTDGTSQQTLLSSGWGGALLTQGGLVYFTYGSGGSLSLASLPQ